MKKREKVGLMLALGYSKKEVACKMQSSVNTIDNHAQHLYRETGCRNLADITRYMVRRYSGLPIEDILIHAANDCTFICGVAFLTWCAMQPETLEKLSAAFSTVSNFLTNIL
jgi:DNA-binding CsgD family transcriptional regulator